MQAWKITDYLEYKKETQKHADLIRAILNNLKYADLGEFLDFVSTVDRAYPEIADRILESDVVRNRVQEYIHKAFGIVMPMHLPIGWTDSIKELVSDIVVDGWDKVDGKTEFMVKHDNEDLMRGTISRQRLLKMLSHIPLPILFTRNNESPMFLDFVDIGCDDAYYEIYIVGKERFDERVTIEGILLPIFDCDNDAWLLLQYAIRPPEEFWHIKVNDKVYLRMWWD